jgi:hypothetical protein
MSENDLKRLGAKVGLALLFPSRYYAFLTEQSRQPEPSAPQWQVPLPESVKVPPAIGMNL